MRDEKIDIHNSERNYMMARSRLQADASICPENRKLILSFIDDSAIGKTARRRARSKSVGIRSRLKSLYLLRMVAIFFGSKSFKALTVRDVERLIRALDEDVIRPASGAKYAEQTKSGTKKQFIMLLRWLFGEDSKKFLAMTYWIDTRFKRRTIPSLGEDEVRELLMVCTTLKQKVIVTCLFDGGFRIEEFLNIRNPDVSHVAGEASYYRMRVREEFSKTQGRDVPMFWSESYDVIRAWLALQKNSPDPSDRFFPSTYAAVLMTLKRIGKKVGKNLYPHLFRHSSATYYAIQGLSEFQMNKRYGWSSASDMGRHYVEQTKIVLEGEKQVKQYEEYKLGTIKTNLQKQVQENGFLRETVETFRSELQRQEREVRELRTSIQKMMQGFAEAHAPNRLNR